MKKVIISALVFIMILFSAFRSFAQVRPSRQVSTVQPANQPQQQVTTVRQQVATQPQPQTTTVQQQPAKDLQQNNSPGKGPYRENVGNAKMIQAIPVPKKILFLTKPKQLAMMNEQVITSHIMAYSPGKVNTNSPSSLELNNARNTLRQMSILGMTTKSYGKGHKAGFVLTNKISGWTTNPSYNIKKAQVTADNTDPSWNCTVSKETVSAQSTSFMNASQNEQGQHLYPGAIYSFDDYAGGNFKAFEAGMNPLDIFTNTVVGTNTFTVTNPTTNSIGQAISNIVGQFSPQQGGATILQQTLYSDNESDLAIAVSAGGAYDGYSGSDMFSHNESEHHIYITLDAIKSLYTISAHRPADGYFAGGQIPQANSALVVVQDVTYGARLLANIDITLTSKTDMNKFQFAYNAIAASGFLNLDALAHDATITYKINAYMVGVPASTGIIKTLDNFEKQLDNIFSQSNYRNARPIQYSLTDLDGNYLGVESMTDQFTVRNCTPADEVFTLQNAFLTINTGKDNKNSESSFDFYLIGEGPNGEASISVYSDNSTEIVSNSSNTYKLEFNNPNHPNPYTKQDFSNGGRLFFRFSYGIAVLRTGDDWDISHARLTLNFLSQKGTHESKTIEIEGFRLSSGNGHNDIDSKTIYFNNNFEVIK